MANNSNNAYEDFANGLLGKETDESSLPVLDYMREFSSLSKPTTLSLAAQDEYLALLGFPRASDVLIEANGDFQPEVMTNDQVAYWDNMSKVVGFSLLGFETGWDGNLFNAADDAWRAQVNQTNGVNPHRPGQANYW
ncbi:MAG TPA: hypothetical protein V6D17_17460 [Candidatus Obscuribacterales bacterium]